MALKYQSVTVTNIFKLGVRSEVSVPFLCDSYQLNYVSLRTFLLLVPVIISNSVLIVCPLHHKNLLERSCIFHLLFHLLYTEHGAELYPLRLICTKEGKFLHI